MRTTSPSLTATLSAGSDSAFEIATFCRGAMTPEITAEPRTVVAFATAVGIGAGDGAVRAFFPPRPHAATATTARIAAAERTATFKGYCVCAAGVAAPW